VSHGNARLTFHGRLLVVRRVIQEKKQPAQVADELGVSRGCVYKWIARYRAEGEDGLHDRSSRPRTSPNRTPAAVEARVLQARRELRAGPDRIAEETGVPPRTVTRILRRRHVPRLAECDPLTGAPIRASRQTRTRYEHEHAGSLVHLDVKKIGRIPQGGGWRAHGRGERPADKRRIGYDYIHVAVDDHSRLAYAETLSDEKGPTCAEFLTRAAAWFAAQGIPRIERVLTDNAKNYTRSHAFAAALAAIGARHKTIRPHCPWQNGKAERFNRTLQTEWAYRRIYLTNTDRTTALAPWLDFYNTQRHHTALGGQPPISRVALSPT
jgi:transposase InsO family protein